MFKPALLAASLVFAACGANAAELKLLIGGAMQEPFREVGAAYAKKSGNTLDFTVDTTGALQNKLRAGAPADLILVSAPGMGLKARIWRSTATEGLAGTTPAPEFALTSATGDRPQPLSRRTVYAQAHNAPLRRR